VQIGESVAIGAEEMDGDRADGVAREEGDEADLAGELSEEEVAAAEIEEEAEAVGDLARRGRRTSRAYRPHPR